MNNVQTEAVSAIGKCRKVVVAAVHGACIGGGIDIITACDIRYYCEDAKFSVKEVDVGINANFGTLQHPPGIVGFRNAMELALTGRLFCTEEAKGMGLVSKVFGSKNELDQGVHAIAQGIASKSPLAVIGTKNVLLKSRDMSVQQGLDYVATWNSSMLLSDDLKEVISAQKQKRKPSFSKLLGDKDQLWMTRRSYREGDETILEAKERVRGACKVLRDEVA
ncbi:delta(3,5)-delta(2,4)-dienoyl-CoA isomerase, peroxisomal [Tanacetum coccineum]